MPDERAPIAPSDRTEAALKAVHDELVAFRLDTHGRLSKLEGGFEQMDKRMSSVEALQKWAIGLIITFFLAVVGMFMAILSKLH